MNAPALVTSKRVASALPSPVRLTAIAVAMAVLSIVPAAANAASAAGDGDGELASKMAAGRAIEAGAALTTAFKGCGIGDSSKEGDARGKAIQRGVESGFSKEDATRLYDDSATKTRKSFESASKEERDQTCSQLKDMAKQLSSPEFLRQMEEAQKKAGQAR